MTKSVHKCNEDEVDSASINKHLDLILEKKTC